MYVDVEQKNWDEILPFVTFAYNTAKQETTGFTPFYLLHGREAETTLDTMLPFCLTILMTITSQDGSQSRRITTASPSVHSEELKTKIVNRRYDSKRKWYPTLPEISYGVYTPVLNESRSFFRVHTGYFSNIPKCIKAEFIASWACSQSSVVSSSQR
ncbi:transposon Ty3-I Gag-Pol polyprotein [Trichonephila clavipes]|nr:transposon Ty3-I Gag-Pol polyprotein [Trichonephila clavipes]